MKKVISILMTWVIVFNIISYIFIPNESMALSSSYTQSVSEGIDTFPESYRESLNALHELHPNWIFKAYNTGIDWSELTSSAAENACLKNTIKKIGLMDPAMLCRCGRTGDSGYYCASAKTVNYYLDPRNFLTESSVYQFLDLSNSTSISREVIQSVVSGTYLEQYIDSIMDAASESGINPLHIVVTIFQELGKKSETPRAISGTVEGYEGLYNFYNVGANDGEGAVERGLEKARELGWTDPRTAIIGGAVSVLKNGYISRGQTTKYFYKFDVVGNDILGDNETKTYDSSLFFNHQYMTNIQDPLSQSAMLMEYYTNYGIYNSSLVFTIPVYNNMPETPVSFPTSLTSQDGEFYTINTTYVNSLNVKDENGENIGKLIKGQIVAVQSIEGNRATLKLRCATTLENGQWNYEDRIVYLNNASYLSKNGTNYVPPPDTPVSTEKIKIEEDRIKMVPATNVSLIKEKYPNAVITNAEGTEIIESEQQIGTGYKIIIDGVEYIAVKMGDTNGDGEISPLDYVKIKNHIMQVTELENSYLSAADLNADNEISPLDYVKVKNYIMDVSEISL